jgi:hypothetical protein
MDSEARRSYDSVLNYPPIARTRRNHGFEHATLHILSRRNPSLRLAGHSDPGGFWLIGDVSLEEVKAALEEALQRLQAGESNLAVHPNCGTNFVTSGILASMAALAAMFGAGRRFQDKLWRLPLAATLATVALIASQPLGRLLQERVTTSGQLETMRVVNISPSRRGKVNAFRVSTQS